MTTTRRYTPSLEALEDRKMFTTASLSNGLLFVEGTQASDTIVIRQIDNVVRVSGVSQGYWASQVNGIVVDGKNGNDTIILSNPALESGVQYIQKPSLLAGGNGNDTIVGGASIDVIFGGAGQDEIYGLWGNDILIGGSGDDEIYGGDGHDRLYGQDGNDWLDGGAGNDYLDGGLGSDWLYGNAGSDLLYGGADYTRDYFYNPATNDRLFTNYGEDMWYLPSTQVYRTVPQSSSLVPTTSYTNPGRGVISQLLSPLANSAASSVYTRYVQGQLPNMFSGAF
jgi:Ca2+-binding RTX toxin-like protein